MSTVKITIGKIAIGVELLDTPTAKAIAANLPFGSKAKVSGDEVYIETPITAELEDDAKDNTQLGDICFWPEGQCIVIRFGPSPVPIQIGDEIKLVSKTNVWGKALNDATDLKTIKSDDFVFIEQV